MRQALTSDDPLLRYRREREAREEERWRRHLLTVAERTDHPDSLLRFVQYTSPPNYQAGWVHRDLCRRLSRFSRQVEAGESPRLVIAMPPRHGKTHIVSRRYPDWHLALYPDHEFVCASYGQELADDNSRDAREVARGDALDVFPHLRPKKPEKTYYADYKRTDVDRVNNWKVPGGGGYKAVGVGGPLTGRGAHVLCIDDPIKDMAAAESPTERRRLWSWYQSVAYTRLAPGGGIIIMATRWHHEDLTGLVLRQPDEGWEVVSYPAIAEKDEEFRREGEALHPERYPLEHLERIKAGVGERVWASLYQQRPTPLEGGMIKREWFRERYHCQPEDIAATADEVWISADAAKKGTALADFNAIQCWAKKDGKRYPLDRVYARMGSIEYFQAMDAMIAKWCRFIVRTQGGCLVEDTANGTNYLDAREPAYMGVALVRFHPSKDTPGDDKSKGARARFVERAGESGAIIPPDPSVAPWVGDWLENIVAFPLGANDDDMDATSQINMRWTLEEQGQASHRSWFDMLG